MSKQIVIEYENEKYTLEFTRKSVMILESKGFRIDQMGDRPLEMLPKLFYGSFLAHHPNIDEDFTLEIFEQIPNKGDFIEKLAEMYSDPLSALIGDIKQGKVKWEVNW